MLVRLFTRLHTAPSFSFYPCRRYEGLILKINIDTLKEAKDLIHISEREIHRHFDFFFLIINQCFLYEGGLPSESPSTYNYSLVVGQSADIADLPSIHVNKCPKQHLRKVLPVSKDLIFVHRAGYYCL